MSSGPLDKHKSIDLISYHNDGKVRTVIADKVEKRESLFQFANRYARGQRPQFGAEAEADRSSGYMHDGTQITCFGATSGGRLDDAVADQADTCVPCAGPVATVRDGSRRAASVGRSRRSEHPGAEVSVAETLIGRACEQPGFAVSDVRCSRRTTVTPSSRQPRPDGAG